MPRDGSGVYSLPVGYAGTAGTKILSTTQHNTPFEDLQADANTARPIVAGGTGATSAASACTNLKAVSYASQTLTSAEQTQAATNLGLADVATSGSYYDLTTKLGDSSLGSWSTSGYAIVAKMAEGYGFEWTGANSSVVTVALNGTFKVLHNTATNALDGTGTAASLFEVNANGASINGTSVKAVATSGSYYDLTTKLGDSFLGSWSTSGYAIVAQMAEGYGFEWTGASASTVLSVSSGVFKFLKNTTTNALDGTGAATTLFQIDTSTVSCAGHIAPLTDLAGNCGTSSKRWAAVYANNGTIQTSDARLKDNFAPLNNALAIADQIDVGAYDLHDGTFADGALVRGAVKHRTIGVKAQQVRAAFPSFGGIVDGDEDKEVLGLVESKIGVLALAAVKELAARVAFLEKQLAESKK